jgi:hypothetical protein
MTSNIENELKAQVSEFARSDEALKEIIARLSELEGLIAAKQKSRESLDSTTSSINQLAANLGTFLTLSVDSVGNISKVSTDIGSTIQRIEAEISSAVASNLADATKEIRLAVSHIETVAKSLAQDVESIGKSQNSLSTKVNQSTKSLTERVNALEVNLIQEVTHSATNTWVIIGVSTILVALITYFI